MKPSESNSSNAARPRIAKADLLAIAKLSLLGLPSWLVPISRLETLSAAIGAITGLWHRAPHPIEPLVAGTLAGRVATPPSRIVTQWKNLMRVRTMQALALCRPGRRWHPTIRLHGADRVTAALARERGAILWVSRFAYTRLATIIGLSDAGFRVYQLHRPGHGFSETPFGIRHLNPLHLKIEARYIAGLITIDDADPRAAYATMRERLAENAVVWIGVGNVARRTLDVPFLGGIIRVATGPLHLAGTTGAAILPVFTIRAEDGSYDVTIEPPLEPSADAGDDYAEAVRAYANLLERYVLDRPDQWVDWQELVVRPSEERR
jgi:lauroyl/myristoyl acyltransferase